jgi:hypothetical protein
MVTVANSVAPIARPSYPLRRVPGKAFGDSAVTF